MLTDRLLKTKAELDLTKEQRDNLLSEFDKAWGLLRR